MSYFDKVPDYGIEMKDGTWGVTISFARITAQQARMVADELELLADLVDAKNGAV